MTSGMAGMAEKALPAPAWPAPSRVDVADRARRFAMLFAFSLLVVDAAWPADVFARHGTAVHERHQKKRHETGFASFYGREWANHRTANGERFDPGELTAAHRTLPFGTRVKVTNLENGRHVVVRINDRGPFVPGRIVDLSQAAAKALGILDRGTAPVRVEVFASDQ
jgi:rare lipoprotein A